MSTAEETKIALEKYRNVIGYLQYENTTFWTRSGFMLVAQSALLGFLSRALPAPGDRFQWFPWDTAFGLAGVGLMLSFLWTRAIDGALWWIQRWHRILAELEGTAYGDLDVFRGVMMVDDKDTDRHSTRNIARQVAVLFRIVWLATLAYLVWLAVTQTMSDAAR